MARASSLPELARQLLVAAGRYKALRCRCFRIAVTVAHRAIAASPKLVVADASTRVVTGGVLPVTTRRRRHSLRRQAAYFRVTVFSDGAKRPASQASPCDVPCPFRADWLKLIRARRALHGPWVIGPRCCSSLRERAAVPQAHAAQAGSIGNRIHGSGVPRP
jgi:hypothetical protein